MLQDCKEALRLQRGSKASELSGHLGLLRNLKATRKLLGYNREAPSLHG